MTADDPNPPWGSRVKVSITSNLPAQKYTFTVRQWATTITSTGTTDEFGNAEESFRIFRSSVEEPVKVIVDMSGNARCETRRGRHQRALESSDDGPSLL